MHEEEAAQGAETGQSNQRHGTGGYTYDADGERVVRPAGCVTAVFFVR